MKRRSGDGQRGRGEFFGARTAELAMEVRGWKMERV